MEDYLLDTNIVSLALNGADPRHLAIRHYLTTLASSRLFLAAISLAEVYYGLNTSPAMDSVKQQAVRTAVALYDILGVDRHTAENYANIRAALFRKYSPVNKRGRLTKKHPEQLLETTTGLELGIDENDLWIVSIAVQYNLKLLTSDNAGGMRRVVEAANYDAQTEF
jgi:tRNA(fMet)-specific endonuclease VapC